VLALVLQLLCKMLALGVYGPYPLGKQGIKLGQRLLLLAYRRHPVLNGLALLGHALGAQRLIQAFGPFLQGFANVALVVKAGFNA
jgi:hypothetical protein